jgi:putative RNA 2'-phosphotransferase
MGRNLESKSKFLSLVLRHKPHEIGLELDNEGWASIEQLVKLSAAKGHQITRDDVLEITLTSDKKRFAISQSGKQIRANQGHSIAVQLNLPSMTPPTNLFHGTATRFAKSIEENGLVAGSRQHVHLSLEKATAVEVGKRHGKPLVLKINTSEMHRDGIGFYLAENGVWLTVNVPSKYIEFPAK